MFVADCRFLDLMRAMVMVCSDTAGLTRSDVSVRRGGRSRMRLIGAQVLTVLVLLAFVGTLAFYVEHTALDEDGFKTVSRNLIEDDEIRTQVRTPWSTRCTRMST
jgi:hypothetical protein